MKQLAPPLVWVRFVWAGMVAGAFAQGPLAPPGAPAPTMKTLAQVEPRIAVTGLPFNINVPGSYYLTTNISGSVGVSVSAENVTLDLNGFALEGSAATTWGIYVNPTARNFTLRNGVVSRWTSSGQGGMYIGASGGQVESVMFYSNHFGVFADAPASRVVNCAAVSNNSTGINVREGVVLNSVAHGNGGHGIVLGTNSVADNCAAIRNRSYGLWMERGSILQNSTIAQNAMSTMFLRGGIRALTGNRVINCIIELNATDGLSLGSGNSVSDCVIVSNEWRGILAIGSDNHIRHNHLVANGTWSTNYPAIHLLGRRNVVLDNSIIGNGQGISAPGSTNFVVRNVVYANLSTSSLDTAQAYGPFIGQMGPITNTNPWANFGF